ncbi:MAG TPA: hypothetical protein DD656_01350 [Alphaproteobacteria bacterium]|nr:hypothetical protein [Alphaproteobacteria bacterium]
MSKRHQEDEIFDCIDYSYAGRRHRLVCGGGQATSAGACPIGGPIERCVMKLLITPLMFVGLGVVAQAQPISILPKVIKEAETRIGQEAEASDNLGQLDRLRMGPSPLINRLKIEVIAGAMIPDEKKRQLFEAKGLWDRIKALRLSNADGLARDASLFAMGGDLTCLDARQSASLSVKGQLVCHALAKDAAGAEASLALEPALAKDPFAEVVLGAIYDVDIPLGNNPDLYDAALSIRALGNSEGIGMNAQNMQIFADHPSPRLAFDARKQLLKQGVLQPSDLAELLSQLPEDGQLGGLLARLRTQKLTPLLLDEVLAAGRAQNVTASLMAIMASYVESLEIEQASAATRLELYLALYLVRQDDVLNRLAARAGDEAFAQFLAGQGDGANLDPPFAPTPAIAAIQMHEPFSQEPAPLAARYVPLERAVAENNHVGVMNLLAGAGLDDEAEQYRREVVQGFWPRK